MDPDPSVERTSAPAFEDGLGRRHVVDGGGESLEVLTVRPDLAAAPSFEFAVRERATRLAGFRRACYGHVRSVERVDALGPMLAVVSERVVGTRLSEVLAVAERHQVPLEIDAALCLLRQLVQAVALLHENVPDVSHGAIAPARIIVTPQSRLVIADYVFGAALRELDFSRERYWKELRIAVPAGAGAPRLDRRADVTQVGVVALAAVLGRPLRDDDYPTRIHEIVEHLEATTAGGTEPISPGLRTWITRALQLDPRTSYGSAVEAGAELENVLNDSDYSAAPAALQAFMTRCDAANAAPQADGAPAIAVTATRAARAPAPSPSNPAAPSQAGAKLPAVSTAPGAPPPPRVQPATASATPIARPPLASPAAVVQPSVASPAPVAKPPQASPGSTVQASIASSAPASNVSGTPPPAPPLRTPAAPAIESVPAARPAAAPNVAAEPVLVSGPPPRAIEPLTSAAATPRPRSAMADQDAGHPGYAPSRSGWSRGSLVGAAVVLIALTSGVTMATRRYLNPPAAQPGTLNVTTSTAGVLVVIDGYTRGRTPLSTELAPGDHTVELVTDSGRRKIPVTMAPGGNVSQFVEVAAPGIKTGKVYVRTDPAGARVSVDGNFFGSSPITIDGLAPGPHSVSIGDEPRTVIEKVTIEAGATASLVVPIGNATAASTPGWVSVTAPVEVQIFENQSLVGSSRTTRIMMPAGKHQLEIVNESLGYRSSQVVQVQPGAVATIKPAWPKGTVAINALPWAEVLIDGDRVGETPLGSVSLPVGPHEVTFRHPQLGEQRHQIVVRLTGVARLSVDLRKK